MAHRCTCTVCGELFTSRMSIAKYCRPLCASRAFNAQRKADGRQSEQRAKLAEYNKQYRTNYYQQSIQVIPCTACGTPVTRGYNARYRQPACSPRCKQYLRNGTWPSTPIPDRHPIRSTPVPPDHPSRAARCTRCNREYYAQHRDQVYCTKHCSSRAPGARFSAGTCIRCGVWYIRDRMAYDNHSSRCCSSKCSKRLNASLRRVRKHGAYVANVSPQYIYARDNWTCQLCHRKVDRRKAVPHQLAPTLDHIVPLAQGGKHEPSNVWTAHFLCNCRKSDRGGGEQLMLFG
jgi:hypothetical protein